MIPNWSWNWESWQNYGLSEIWHSGRSAGKRRTVRRSWELFTRGSAEKSSTGKLHSGRSAKGPRTVRQCWEEFTRGKIQSDGSVKIQRRTVRQDTADSPLLDRKVGSARLDLYWMSLSQPPPNRTHHQKALSLSFSLKHLGETTRSRLFGVVPGRSENIPGLFSRLCIMSSRYFDESLTLVLGFLYWKDLGLDAPICFWPMDSWKYLGDLIPSDEEML